MDDDRPSPPETLDPELRAMLEALAEEDAETIRTVAAHADDLAAWAESRSGRESESADDGPPYPDEVPSRASATVTTVDGVEYYYYQWRDGDEIRSKTERRNR